MPERRTKHDHGHHEHDHSHAHDHAHSAPSRPRRSLMALSGIERLMMVLPLILGLWLLTYWALING